MPLPLLHRLALHLHWHTVRQEASGRRDVAGEVAGRLLGFVPLQPELDGLRC